MKAEDNVDAKFNVKMGGSDFAMSRSLRRYTVAVIGFSLAGEDPGRLSDADGNDAERPIAAAEEKDIE